MKEIPVIQPYAQPPDPPQPSELQTAGLINDAERLEALRPKIVEALSKVFDPEIPVNIYELGLIYDILADRAGVVGIRMTLTAPSCPAAQSLPVDVKRRVEEIPEVTEAKVDVVWEPPWDRDRMSEAAKLQLGMF
jgi:FeS assembly SUF system protein